MSVALKSFVDKDPKHPRECKVTFQRWWNQRLRERSRFENLTYVNPLPSSWTRFRKADKSAKHRIFRITTRRIYLNLYSVLSLVRSNCLYIKKIIIIISIITFRFKNFWIEKKSLRTKSNNNINNNIITIILIIIILLLINTDTSTNT